MNSCKKTRPFLPLLVAGNLDECDARSIELHLANCSECRRILEKSRNLREVLALKRYEQPDKFFFRTYLSEFHRRLCLEVIQKQSFWRRCREMFVWEKTPIHFLLRLSYGAAIAVVLLSLYTAHLSMKYSMPEHFSAQNVQSRTQPIKPAIVEVTSVINQLVAASDVPSGKGPFYVLDRVDYKPLTHTPIVLEF